MKRYITTSEEETKTIANQIAKEGENRIICLYGDLGAGKTVFAKGYVSALGVSEKNVKSPTYTFVREYKTKDGPVFHFDFYRIEEVDDIMAHDIAEIFSKKNSTIIVEWPGRIESLLPEQYTKIYIKYINKTERAIRIKY